MYWFLGVFCVNFLLNAVSGQYVTNSSDVNKIIKCAKCFYFDGKLPLNLQQLVPMPAQNDPRCAYWNDRIPTSEYETCSTPNDGESNACVYFNMTIVIQNIVSSTLNQVGNITDGVVSQLNNISDTINNFATNPYTAVLGLLSSLPVTIPKLPITIPTVPVPINVPINNNPFGGFGRKKRQAHIARPLASVTIPVKVPTVQNVPNLTTSNNGTYVYKLWYKGCVKLSLLETLLASNCKLTPILTDINFFSQQALLQPVMDLINMLSYGLTNYAGVSNKVDGLCYFMKKEFTKTVWKSLLHYDPETMQKVMQQVFGG